MKEKTVAASRLARRLALLIVEALADDPDSVHVNLLEVEDGFMVELAAPGSEIGRLIGRAGRNARAIRTIMSALGAQAKCSIHLNIRNTSIPQE